MKDYSAARKKLENRRIGYDASMNKLQKARRDDFRIEEEVRSAKAKYEETSEDVVRRMCDIKESEGETVRDLSSFLDAELEYHERCAEELRRVRRTWAGEPEPTSSTFTRERYQPPAPSRSRSSTQTSVTEKPRLSRRSTLTREESAPEIPMRIPVNRSLTSSRAPPPEPPAKPSISRSMTYQSSTTQDSRAPPVQPLATIAALRGQTRSARPTRNPSEDVFGDQHEDSPTGSESPDWDDRYSSPATSVASLNRSTTSLSTRKAPPPPPCRSKKPAPPIPAKRFGSEMA